MDASVDPLCILLSKSNDYEIMKQHFFNLMDQLDVLMSEHPEMTSLDFADEYVAAAKFATRTLGRKYSTDAVENWMDTQEDQ